MALYSDGPTEVRPYIVTALESYGPIELWSVRLRPNIVTAHIVMAHFGWQNAVIVMAPNSCGPKQLWPYIVLALHSSGPT